MILESSKIKSGRHLMINNTLSTAEDFFNLGTLSREGKPSGLRHFQLLWKKTARKSPTVLAATAIFR